VEQKPAAPARASGWMVTTASVAVYGYRSTAGAPIAILAPDSPIEIVERQDQWVSVRAPDALSGWVSVEFLDIDGENARAKSNVRVRLMPEISDQGAPLAEGLKTGDRVKVVKRRGDWAQVRLPKRFTGWIHVSDLAVLAPRGR